jgi:hypothetical protein
MGVFGVNALVGGLSSPRFESLPFLLLYLLTGIVFLVPAFYLHKYARRIKRFVAQGHQVQLEAALEAQRKFWKYTSILAVVVFVALTLVLFFSGVAYAQERSDPHIAMPERPTVATHAWTVAPRYVELETGAEWDRNRDASFALSTPTIVKIGVGRRAQLGLQASVNAASGTSLGMGDAGIVVKYRLTDAAPVVGAFAVLPGIKFPSGSGAHGTGTTDASIVLISSHDLGEVALDVNVGYTRRSGDGTGAPRHASVWTISTGGPLAGSVGFAAEIFGFPATSGPSGAPGSVAILGGPTVTVRPWAVLDAGVIVRLRGQQPNAVYGGLVYNFGKVW